MLSVLGIWIRDERKSEDSILGRVIYCSVEKEREREEMEEERRKRGEGDCRWRFKRHPGPKARTPAHPTVVRGSIVGRFSAD